MQQNPVERMITGIGLAVIGLVLTGAGYLWAATREEGAQPPLLRLPEGRHPHPAVRPADDRAQGDGDDVHQQVLLRALHPRVGQWREMRADAGAVRPGHPRPPPAVAPPPQAAVSPTPRGRTAPRI